MMVTEMEHYKYVTNKKCEYYPCHQTDEDFFNCLFCFCPLYTLGETCGGNFTYSKKGFKNCSACSLPHRKDGYDFVKMRLAEVLQLAAKKE